MKETRQKRMPALPYSLHDARMNRLEIKEDEVILHFDEGYYMPEDDDCVLVKGDIVLQKVDLDFCQVYILNTDGNKKKFSGEILELVDFVNRYPKFDFEIIDETYSGYLSKFAGYFYEGDYTKECIMEFLHFKPMLYRTEK